MLLMLYFLSWHGSYTSVCTLIAEFHCLVHMLHMCTVVRKRNALMLPCVTYAYMLYMLYAYLTICYVFVMYNCTHMYRICYVFVFVTYAHSQSSFYLRFHIKICFSKIKPIKIFWSLLLNKNKIIHFSWCWIFRFIYEVCLWKQIEGNLESRFYCESSYGSDIVCRTAYMYAL